MKTRPDLIAFFDAHGIDHATTDHEAVFRVGEGEGIKDDIPGAHTKNLFLKDAKGRLWLISAKDDTPGSVTAFALINDGAHDVTFVLDRRLAQAERVNFHPLVNTATTGVSQAGFARFLQAVGVTPLVVDFEAMAVVEDA